MTLSYTYDLLLLSSWYTLWIWQPSGPLDFEIICHGYSINLVTHWIIHKPLVIWGDTGNPHTNPKDNTLCQIGT